MANDDTTLAPEARAKPGRRGPPKLPCLVLVWSADEPERVGEVLQLPAGRTVTLGRHPVDDTHVGLVRQQAGRAVSTGALGSGYVSRAQLELTRGERIAVSNAGRCVLRVNGAEVDSAELRPGDQVELVDAYLFVVSVRPLTLPIQGVLPGHVFGGPDSMGFVGESPAVWSLRARLHQVAARRGHVLILGASGTGKELCAQAIHSMSERGDRPLVARNAATLPHGLVDAELFGNVRNYPNPGMAERPGLIGQADRSSLFLDEIGELPQEVQAHLLRVLDQGEYSRLGEAAPRTADLRLIAATNRPESMLKHDLLARFAVHVHTPSLAERPEDVPLLARHLLRAMCDEDPTLRSRFFDGDQPRLSVELVRSLLDREWEGNVRELHRLLWDAVDRSSGDVIEAARVAAVAEESADDGEGLSAAVVQAALDRHNGVQSKVWKELGLSSRYALARLIKKYGLVVRKRG